MNTTFPSLCPISKPQVRPAIQHKKHSIICEELRYLQSLNSRPIQFQRTLSNAELNAKFGNINFMFYFITNSLIRMRLMEELGTTGTKTLRTKNPNAGSVRKKFENQSNLTIFNHHSSINNFNFFPFTFLFFLLISLPCFQIFGEKSQNIDPCWNTHIKIHVNLKI